MTFTIEQAHGLWIEILERHQDEERWAEPAIDEFVAEMRRRGFPKQNALVLLNKLMNDINDWADEHGANPN